MADMFKAMSRDGGKGLARMAAMMGGPGGAGLMGGGAGGGLPPGLSLPPGAGLPGGVDLEQLKALGGGKAPGLGGPLGGLSGGLPGLGGFPGFKKK